MVEHPTGASVVQTVIRLAHAFNMTTVAEGVETQEQLNALLQMHCDQSQGYLHSRPLTAEDFGTVLRIGRGALLQPPALPEAEAQKPKLAG
jgi:EAL domain-containing protein (putative c-di-GMP-specific phosphodiesterase class I)